MGWRIISVIIFRVMGYRKIYPSKTVGGEVYVPTYICARREGLPRNFLIDDDDFHYYYTPLNVVIIR